VTRCQPCHRRGLYRCACSRKRSVKVLAHLRSVAHAGGKAGGAVRRAAAAKVWDLAARDMTPGQIARAFYKRGINNGDARGERRGYAKGFAAGYDQARRELQFQSAIQGRRPA